MEKVKVKIVNTGEEFKFESGITIYKVGSYSRHDIISSSLCAKINNKLVDLNYAVRVNSKIEFLNYYSGAGLKVYKKTAVFILEKVVKDLYPNAKIVTGMHLENGHYFDFIDKKIKLTKRVIKKIKKKFNEEVNKNTSFIRRLVNFNELIEYFKKLKLYGNAGLVRSINKGGINVYQLGKFIDLCLYPLAPSTGYIRTFDIIKYGTGFILRFPAIYDINNVPPLQGQYKLYKVYDETKKWYRILDICDVGTLNDKINKNEINEIIKVAEALQEKKIAKIADEISKKIDNIRIILIAGPTSSGKTTFSKRLFISLRVNNIKPLVISLDDYFLDRDKTPKDKYGNYDFESLRTLNIRKLNRHLTSLLEGKQVELPKYDFELGKSRRSGIKVSLEKNQIIIIEGIHGLNEKLTESIKAQNKYKIFVSAMAQLRISDTVRIATSDTRLIRRVVRDYRFRGYDAKETIKRWTAVRRGEEKYIFPYQENADVMFNSGIVYELAVFKSFALPILKKITTDEKEYPKAQRLISLLNLFDEVPTAEIPPTSIIREFIGGSSFHY